MNSGFFTMDSDVQVEKFMEGRISDILTFKDDTTGLKRFLKRFKSRLKEIQKKISQVTVLQRRNLSKFRRLVEVLCIFRQN
jgi:hypothetical protein